MADITNFVITLREVLEAVLIVSIILSYLHKTNQKHLTHIAWLGAAAGIVGSIVIAVLFSVLVGEFEGFWEQLFEGTTMLIGAILITYLIVWLLKRNRAEHLRNKVSASIGTYKEAGLFLLVGLSIMREGVETVLFLYGSAVSAGTFSLIGPILGVIVGLGIGYLVYKEIEWIPWKQLFLVTSVLLVLFAAGLVSNAAHEFTEAGITPPLIEHVWDINPPLNADGTYPLLHEEGVVGSLLNGLLGYKGAPSLLEVLAYVGYLVLVGCIYFYQRKVPHERKRMEVLARA